MIEEFNLTNFMRNQAILNKSQHVSLKVVLLVFTVIGIFCLIFWLISKLTSKLFGKLGETGGLEDEDEGRK